MSQRARQLLETSGLDVEPAETIPALAPQMSSPPENDLQNNKGLDLSPGNNRLEGGWVKKDKPQSTHLRNATLSPVGYMDQNSVASPVSTKTAYDESFPNNRAQYIRHLVLTEGVLESTTASLSKRLGERYNTMYLTRD
jgi:hypothetical protein